MIRDRIFIAKELRYETILEDWDTAVANFEKPGGDLQLFSTRFTALNSKLVEMALNPPPKGIKSAFAKAYLKLRIRLRLAKDYKKIDGVYQPRPE